MNYFLDQKDGNGFQIDSMQAKIIIIHPEGNLNNNPNLIGIIEILCEQGYQVHYYAPVGENGPAQSPCPGATIFLIENGHLYLHDRYDLVIGVDRGIIPAVQVAKDLEAPCGYISYEIFFTDETGLVYKLPEIQACQQIAFAVTQDEVRASLLARENQIAPEKIIRIPVAGKGILSGDPTYVLHETLNLDKDKKIALYMGSINSRWTMIDQLLASTAGWDDSWALVLHHRYGNTQDVLTELRQQYPQAKNIYFSPFQNLSFQELHKLIQTADLGIALYNPQYTDRYNGKNLQYIGLASGKIATYLQHGVPVLINEIGQMADYVRQAQLGVVIQDANGIPQALNQISKQSRAFYQENCFKFFSSYMDLSVTIQPLIEQVNQLLIRTKTLRIESKEKQGSGAVVRPSPVSEMPQENTTEVQAATTTGYTKTSDFSPVNLSKEFSRFTYSKKSHFNLFSGSDLKLYHRSIDPRLCDLKVYQDLLVFWFIENTIPKGSRILEIGGGASRILAHFKADFECWNLDKLEGLGNGPREINSNGYRLVKDYIGNFNQELPNNYFDFIFSISALEHVPDNDPALLQKILDDMDRVLKTGGYSLHCFDLLIQESSVWTNKLLPFLFDHINTVNTFLPFEILEKDPDLYVMTAEAYQRSWQPVTQESYMNFGKPLSYNILWQKTPLLASKQNKNVEEHKSINIKKRTGYTLPKISIVTPSFNQAQYLEACIDSILSQNYPNLEYIIMDGGSTDGSLAIIKKYANQLTYWQSQPDGGQYNAINKGFERATGEIMGWLNSDDKLHPQSLFKVAYIFLTHSEVDWIEGLVTAWNRAGHLEWIEPSPRQWSREDFLRRDYRWIQQESTFWRRSLWNKAGRGLDTAYKLAADFDLWARFFRYDQLYRVIDLLGGFRRHGDQRSILMLDQYVQECQSIIDREIALLQASNNKTLLLGPEPITLNQEEFKQFVVNIKSSQAIQPFSRETKPLPVIPKDTSNCTISAIVSTYNSERYIRACLEDLEAQTIADQLEIIVIDSNSPQNERAIVQEFKQRYDNIVYVRTEERETVYAAWNWGIKLARGQYITNANTDDAHRPDALEKLVAALEANPEADLAYAYNAFTDVANDKFEAPHAYKEVRLLPITPATSLFYCSLGPHPVWRRSVFEKIGLFDPQYMAAGDYDFELRFVHAGLRAVLVPEVLSLFCQNQHGLSLNSNASLQEQAVIRNKYRNMISIEQCYQVDPTNPEERAKAWVAQGNLAAYHKIPWEEKPQNDFYYAYGCYQQALNVKPGYTPAIYNAIVVLGLMEQWSAAESLLNKMNPKPDLLFDSVNQRRPVYNLMSVDVKPAYATMVYSGQPASKTIGIDVQTLFNPDSTSRGIGQYTVEHLNSLIRLKPDWQFILYGPSLQPVNSLDRLLTWPNVIYQPINHFKPTDINLLHIPDLMTPTVTPWFRTALDIFQGQTTFTFYDMIPRQFYWDHWNDNLKQDYLYRLTEMQKKQSAVFTISNSSREDLLTHTTISSNDVHSIMAGLNQSENSTLAKDLTATLSQELDINEPFFLYVGSLDPHKNFNTLFACWQQVYRYKPVQLVVVGKYSSFLRAYAEQILQQGIKDIIFTDYIPRTELEWLYHHAVALVYLSRYEGFGLPILEAMANGCPVITTNVTSIPEVAGDATLMFNPNDVSGIVEAMHRLLTDHHLRHTLIEKGKQQAQKFTWEKVAQKTVAVWEQLLEEKLPAASETSQPPAPVIPILWHAPIFDPSGYADEARNFIQRLRSQQFTIAARPLGRHSDIFRAQLEEPACRHLDAALRTEIAPPFISLIHFPASVFQRVPEAAYHIGRVMFETDGLPAEWVAKCNQMDEIWVPTDFNRQTFAAAGVTAKLIKVPGGIDTNQFKPASQPLAIPGARGTVFLSIFEWLYRKGWDVLLRAWAQAFNPADDVTLVLRTYPVNATDIPDGRAEIERRINQFLQTELNLTRSQVAPIIVIGEQIPEADLPRFYAAATAYVSCSRGEGWGRPQMQAMACGLPVIATRWGGNLEFMNDQNSLLLDVDRLVEIDERMEISFYQGQRWAEPAAKHLISLLRWIYEQPDQAKAVGNRARQDMVEHWQWNRIVSIAANRLQTIQVELTTAHTAAKSVPTPIYWEGSQFVNHSMALINREFCLRLSQASNLELSIIPYEANQFAPDTDPRFTLIEQHLHRPLSGPARVHIRHQWPPNFIPPAEGHWVMIQPWEFGSIPKRWIEAMREQVDEVWAYTQYVRDCYIRSGLPADRVHVVSPGVDIEQFRPEAPPLTLSTQKRFKFLFVGGTIERKGIDILLEVYTQTFSGRDDVGLVIKDLGGDSFYKGQTARQWIEQIQADPKAPEIEYIDRHLSDDELAGLYTACDCLVHPYRGEGFALPIAEAMASGLPVIVTGHGAALDFCSAERAYLIPAEEVRMSNVKRTVSYETVDYPWWANPDRSALAQLLRHVWTHPAEARAKGQVALDFIRRHFTWEHGAQAALRRLEAVQRRPIVRFEQRPTPPETLLVLSSPDKSQLPQLGDCLRHLEQFQPQPVGRLAVRLVKPKEISLDLQFRLQVEEAAEERLLPALSKALKHSQAKYVVVLSHDVTVTTGWLDTMIAVAEADPAIAVVGPVSNFGPESQQISADCRFDEKKPQEFAAKIARQDRNNWIQVSQLGDFCLLFKREAVLVAGGLLSKDSLAESLPDLYARLQAHDFKLVCARGVFVQQREVSEASPRETVKESGSATIAAAPAAFSVRLEQAQQAGHWPEAINLLQHMTGQAQDHPAADLWNRLGYCYLKNDQPFEAELAFERGLALAPEHLDLLTNLADLYLSQGRYDQASDYLTRALRVDPDDVPVLLSLGDCAIRLGVLDTATLAFQRVRDLAPETEGIELILQELAAVG